MEYQIYCISSGRSKALPFNDYEKSLITFLVKKGEKNDYLKSKCINVVETGNLMDSRNFAMEDAFIQGKICVQLSDDLKKITLNKNFGEKKEVKLLEAINHIIEKFKKVKGVYLLGVPPTNNDFFAKQLVSKNTFCIGDALFIKPNPLRFDTNLTLKEDYDLTCQHLNKFGVCLRYQKFIWHFEHYTNDGGAVSYRNDTEEKKNIIYLLNKWKGKIKLNRKRKNEILLRW